MANDYTQWPVAANVQTRLASAGVTLRVTTDDAGLMGAILAAVIAEIGSTTRRQFVAGPAGEVRYYDGSGTSEQEVDEMISLTSVAALGLQNNPGFTLANTILAQEQGLPRTRLIRGQGSLPAFPSAGVFAPYPILFPAGRQNIVVTGTFGFAGAIPADLWEAACGEMAHRLAQQTIFTPAGRLTLRHAGDEEERYALAEAEITGWHGRFAERVTHYKRPAGRRLRNLRNRMT